MSAARHGLRRRLVAAFAFFALLSALCFSAFCVLFVYTVEDRFFEQMLEQEAAHQSRAWAQARRLAPPLRDTISLHRDVAGFPPDLARQMPGAARAGEFYGERGRHYHVRALRLPGEAAPIYMVAEVSRDLVVRPRLPFIATFLGLSALAILGVTLGAGYWLAHRATAPLSRLARLMSDAAPGQLPQGFARGFPDNEIGALATALEQAMGRIAAFIERERHFTRDASHELRTPLAVVEGAGYLLARQPLPAQAAEQVGRIRDAAAHMAQSVRTLLALAREDDGDGGPAAWPAGSFAVLPLVEGAVVRYAHLLDGSDAEVDVRVAADARAVCHEAAFAILLDNLVSNAFSHGGRGLVRIYIEEGWLVVADSGPGIAAALRGRVGQPGVKGEGSAGFGLGLSITRRLGERAGIAVRIEHPEGGGVRAALRLAAA
ncbi:sensor histidine kinase [Pseudoduganella namucuonensis]|uniref:histidine kinase n=1 Tax=Pseudoduganella namucuonensis TaxID=1035707 RepID=A0A1I7KVR1_9BURK|nr:HAMP domain-containing sensor histidine kinase [Pseudoduganella namucuonensis]SFV01406.1 Signal transduction histidine kinase [Pseudoduganella namucuonensis]